MISAKISRPLAELLEESDAVEQLDIIVELANLDLGGSPQAAQIATRKAMFAQQAKSVAEAIRRLGGEVTGQAWINGSLRARLAKAAIAPLSDEVQVSRLDLPRALQPEAKSSTSPGSGR